MNKKNFLTTSLASVAVLGAVFFASQTSVVKAAETVDAPTEFVGGVQNQLLMTSDLMVKHQKTHLLLIKALLLKTQM